jgi:DNA-binding CsgD family transcriptional regulator
MKQPDSRINYQFLYHVLPDPVLVIDRVGTIVDLNLSALDVFTSISVGGKIDDLFIDKKKIKTNLLELLQYHKVIADKAIVKTINSEVQTYEYKVTILSESNELFLIAFNLLVTKNELLKLEIEQTFSSELHALLPYLNKSGKELVEKKIEEKKLSTVFDSEVNQLKSSDISDIALIKNLGRSFPQLSESELNIAYFLLVGASIKQIASINNKNTNAIRVMIHRMLAKTSFKNKTDFTNFINANK